MRLLIAVGVRRIVIVRTDSLGYSPVGYGEFRIKFRRMTKRTRGFIVVEGVDETQSLIKKFLRFGTMR